MATRIFTGSVVTPDTVIPDGVVMVEDELITFVGERSAALAAQLVRETDLENLAISTVDGYILPGLVDIHSHGGGGASLPNATTAEQAMQAIMEHRRAGTTSYVASLVTASPQVLKERTELLTSLCEDGELAGIHLEGPFVSHARCGAQDPTYIQVGNPQLTAELCKLARGQVKWMTLAPEVAGNQGSGSVAEVLIQNGALPSWGHTDSEAPDMERALESSWQQLQTCPQALSNRPLVTHLFNGMRPIHHRQPGPVMACLAAARAGKAVLEVIGDGVHVHPDMVREVYQLVGRENLALITDAMEAAGMPDGHYELGSQEVIVEGGVARLAHGDSIAGGTARLIDVVRYTSQHGVPLVDAVYMAATTPATVLANPHIGALEVGRRADLIVTKGGADLEVELVVRGGQDVH